MRRISPGLQTTLIAVMAIATVAVAWAVARNSHADRRATDEANAGALQSAVEALTGQSTARMLDVASALNGLEPAQRRESFQRLSQLVLNEPAVSSIAYLQAVRDRQAYESARTEILDSKDGRAKDAPLYFVVDQRRTKFKGKRRLGVDLYSDPTRRPRIQQAIDTGEAVSTPPLKLLSGARGTALFVPVYRTDMPTRTPAQRRAAVIGVVNAAMRTSTIAHTVKELAPQLDGFKITDASALVAQDGATAGLGPVRNVAQNGRDWRVAAASAPSNVLFRVLAVLLSGAAMIGFAVYAFAQSRRRERYANHIAEIRTEELNRTNGELATERHQLAVAQRIANLGSWVADLEAEEIRWSDEMYQLFGARRTDGPLGFGDWIEMIDEADRDGARAEMNRAISGRGEFEFEFTRKLPDDEGRPVFLASHGFVESDDSGKPTRLVGTVVDVSERRRRETGLQHLADHDPLTGLANRRSFEHTLRSHLADERRRGQGALLMIDLDGLKQINDGLGHAAGDAMIVGAAERIAARLRDGDFPARLGGDEFAVLLPDTDVRQAETIAEALLVRLHDATPELRALGVDSVSASVGVAGVAELKDGGGAAELLELADQAMYAAKQSGRNRVVVKR